MLNAFFFATPTRGLKTPTRGLEILIDCDLKIEASKLKLLERLKEIIELNYEPVVEHEGGERRKEEESDDELDILFVDDEGEPET